MKAKQLKKIIRKCHRHDLKSQQQLYQHFYNYCMTICYRYASSMEEAEEILNDGFLKVFSKIDQYDEKYSFKAWVNRIMVNSSIDHFRRNKNKLTYVEMEHLDYLETSASALENLETDYIFELVHQLPKSYQMVFNLSVVEGFTHKEIAEKLGISTGTSKSNLAKARRKLQAQIIALEQQNKVYEE